MASIMMEVEIPDGMEEFHFPAALNRRLQDLLDRQDSGQQLTSSEREEAEELVNLADWLSLLKARSSRLAANGPSV